MWRSRWCSSASRSRTCRLRSTSKRVWPISMPWRRGSPHDMAHDGTQRVVPIDSAVDIVTARQEGRSLAWGLGFSAAEATVLATAISEVARNIVQYAGRGEVRLAACREGARVGVCVVACDKGPGIVDVDRALRAGYSTQKGLGLGLPGARRLMDEFEIVSEVGVGTTVTLKKWRLRLGAAALVDWAVASRTHPD